MTTDIRTMPAGREMDALVAEKVMGWRPEGDGWVTEERDFPSGHSRTWRGHTAWRPSGEIGHAWEVVDKLTSTTKQWFSCEQSCVTWEAQFRIDGAGDKDGEWTAEGDTMPEAISRAALLAVETRSDD